MAEKKEAATKAYVLIGRKHSGVDKDGNPKDYVEGDTVYLTDTQYEAFGDKFEPKGKHDKEEEAAAAVETPTKPGHDPAPNSQASKAPDNDKDKSSPGSGDKGAGAAQNSTNTAKV